MPIIKSAKKRVRTARKATIRNSKTKRTMRSALKLFTKKITPDSLSSAQSTIDTAIKKGLISKNKAARMKKQLAARAKAAGAKPTVSKKSTAKSVSRKLATTKKTATAKKTTTTKKAVTKKTKPSSRQNK